MTLPATLPFTLGGSSSATYPDNPFIPNPDYFDRKIRAMWFTGQQRTFHVHGDQAGVEGVYIARGGAKNVFNASPVKTTWKTGAFQDGSTQKAVKRLHRDMTVGFHVIETLDSTAEDNEADFEGIFALEEDEWDDTPEPTTLHVDTDKSGVRHLDVLLSDTAECEADVDPIEQQYFNLILKLRAGQPDWYELDPHTGEEYKTVFQSGGTDGEGWIEVENPTDRPMKQKWALTRAQWRVPDVSWKGGRYRRRPGGVFGNRVVELKPITAAQGGIVISLDAFKDLMVRDHNYTNALPALLPGGQHFMHTIPPWTPKTMLPISYVGAPAGGARAELIQPRRWTKPWGQE